MEKDGKKTLQTTAMLYFQDEKSLHTVVRTAVYSETKFDKGQQDVWNVKEEKTTGDTEGSCLLNRSLFVHVPQGKEFP